jgi:hypothetical protein
VAAVVFPAASSFDLLETMREYSPAARQLVLLPAARPGPVSQVQVSSSDPKTGPRAAAAGAIVLSARTRAVGGGSRR